jgi:large subunit ribosomal protein L10
MNKEQKTAVVEELTNELKGADAIFAIDYRGISVPQAAELRATLREADSSFRVVKNRLTLRAADAAGTETIKDFLTGPTALTLVEGDVALAAKTIRRLGDEWELLEYKGGLMEGEPLDPESFVAIAKLPGRDQLNAQFAGVVASPLTGLVRGLGSMVQGLALQLQAIADQGLVTGEAPAEEKPAEPEFAEEKPAEEEPTEEKPAEEEPGDEKPAEEPAESSPAESPTAEEGDPDPEPSESPEEAPSEEEAPEGEEAGEGVPQTGEGDADPGEAQDEGGAPDDEGGEETSDGNDSEQAEENKEDAS